MENLRGRLPGLIDEIKGATGIISDFGIRIAERSSCNSTCLLSFVSGRHEVADTSPDSNILAEIFNTRRTSKYNSRD